MPFHKHTAHGLKHTEAAEVAFNILMYVFYFYYLFQTHLITPFFTDFNENSNVQLSNYAHRHATPQPWTPEKAKNVSTGAFRTY